MPESSKCLISLPIFLLFTLELLIFISCTGIFSSPNLITRIMTKSQSTDFRNYLFYQNLTLNFNNSSSKSQKQGKYCQDYFFNDKTPAKTSQINVATWFEDKLPFSLSKIGIILLVVSFIDMSAPSAFPFSILKIQTLVFLLFWTYFKAYISSKQQSTFHAHDVPDLSNTFFVFLALDPQFALISLAEGPYSDFFKLVIFGAKIKDDQKLGGLVLLWTLKSMFLIRYLVSCLYFYIKLLKFLLFIIQSKLRNENLKNQNQALKVTIEVLEILLYSIQQKNEVFSELVKSTVKRLNPLREAYSMNLSQLTAQKRILQSDIELVNFYIQKKTRNSDLDDESRITLPAIVSNSCCVCLGHKPTVLFSPCLHQCYCSGCFSKELSRKQREINHEEQDDDEDHCFINPMLSFLCPICKRIVESSEDTRRFAAITNPSDFHKNGRLLGILETKNLLTYLEQHPDEVSKTLHFKNELNSVPALAGSQKR